MEVIGLEEKMKKPRILFMGTPAFAVSSLAALRERDYPLLGVVTQPDRPRGRGRQLAPEAVKQYALKHRIPVYQPEGLKGEDFFRQLHELAPELIVVAAFGRLLPREVLEFPPLGCLNVHPSLLPRYRGAAPINWAIINGDELTGVTIMRLDEGMDSGDIILQDKTRILESETYSELHDRLAVLGAGLLLSAIEELALGKAVPLTQDHSRATFAPRIRKEDCLIDWHREATGIVNRIRGLSREPGAFTFLAGKILKVYQAEKSAPCPGHPPGAIVIDGPGVRVAALDGSVSLLQVQRENRAIVTGEEFKRGLRLCPGAIAGK